MIAVLRRESYLLGALMPEADFSSIDAAIGVAERMHAIEVRQDLETAGPD